MISRVIFRWVYGVVVQVWAVEDCVEEVDEGR